MQIREDSQVASPGTDSLDPAPPPVRRWRARLFRGYLLAALVLFAFLTLAARTSPYSSVDLSISQAIQSYRPAWVETLMVIISWPGYAPQAAFLVLALSALVLLLGQRREAIFAALAGGGALAINHFVKLAIERPRPSPDLVRVFQLLSDFSFPSGHVTFYTVFFGFLFFLSYTHLRHSWLRFTLLALFGGLVSLVGLSRVFLGNHWPSDVLGAYLLGSLILAGLVWGYGQQEKRNRRV